MILGVDPGYDRIGFAVMTYEKKPMVLHSECFTTDKHNQYQQRVWRVYNRMRQILAIHTLSAICVEKIFFKNNQKTAIDVAGVRGVILSCASEHSLPVYEYTPAQIKVAVTGVGNADKTQIHKMVSLLVTMKDKKRVDDEVDAVATGIAHIAHTKNNRYV